MHPLRSLSFATLLVLGRLALSTQLTAQPAAYAQAILPIQDAIQASDYARARTMLEAASKRFPANGGLENLMGIVDVQQGRTAQARADFASAIRHDRQLKSAYLNLARLELNDPTPAARGRALRLYDETLRIDPTNPEANFESATLLLGRGDSKASLERLQQMDASARSGVRVESLLCANYAALGQVEETSRAAAAMIASPDLTEDDAAVPLPALRQARRADLIQSIYQAASAHASLSAYGLRVLALAQEANGDLAAAKTTLERLYALDPASSVALIDLARVSSAGKDDTAALGYLAHARALSPSDPALPYQFGLACYRLKMLGEARKALGEAVALAPSDPQYNLAMGTVTAYAQDPLQALPYLFKYNQLRPDDPRGELTIGITYARAKDAEHARPWLLKAAAHPATSAAAHYQLGSLLREESRYDAALQELTQSVQQDKDQPEVLAELGQTYLQMRNYEAAGTQLSAALALDPDSYTANFALLQLYAHNNDPRRAEQARRFDALRDQHEAQYREAMRVIEARPITEQE